MNDAQLTMARILRPFANFESVYQGQNAQIPVAFPGTLDPDAGQDGISPYLLAGIPCPLGAKCIVWIPQLFSVAGEDVTFPQYSYQLHWRYRNLADFNRGLRRDPYHVPRAEAAAPDTALAPANPKRFLIPSASETIIYQQAEPSTVLGPLIGAIGPGVGNLRAELVNVVNDTAPLLASNALPLLPPGTPPFATAPSYAPAPMPPPFGATTPVGLFQQGVLDPGLVPMADSSYSIFRPYFTICKGDDLLITAFRSFPAITVPPDPLAFWNFSLGGVDQAFSNLYGINFSDPHPPFEQLGIYVVFGSNPS